MRADDLLWWYLALCGTLVASAGFIVAWGVIGKLLAMATAGTLQRLGVLTMFFLWCKKQFRAGKHPRLYRWIFREDMTVDDDDRSLVQQLRDQIKQLDHDLGNAEGKASAYTEITKALKPYLTHDKNWLTTVATLAHRVTTAEADRENQRKVIQELVRCKVQWDRMVDMLPVDTHYQQVLAAEFLAAWTAAEALTG